MQKKLTIKLNAKFYDLETIKEALNDFCEVCDGKIIDGKITVELSQKNKLDCPLDAEFSNYVLGLMKNKGLI